MLFRSPPMESDAAEPVSPVPAPVNEEPVMTPVEVRLPLTVEEELAMYPLVKVWSCVQELASERSDAGVARQVPETEKQPAVMLKPLLADVVPSPRVRDPKAAEAEKRFVDDAVVEKRLVVVALVKVLLPEKVLLLVSSVVEEIVMFAVPSKVTPLIVRPV